MRGHNKPKPPPPPKEEGGGLASVEEAARFLSVSRGMVYKLMNNGRLPYTKVGTVRRVPWVTLRAYVQAAVREGSGGQE